MSALLDGLDKLNQEQRTAVLQEGHAVVLAGPGSGKTDTIAVRVGLLMAERVDAPRRVACLTYSTDAVREFTTRLRSLGIHSSQRLFLGTVHSFCLTQIIRPFAALYGRADLTARDVLSTPSRLIRVERALSQCDINERAAWAEPTLTTVRRALACGEDVSRFDEQYVAAAQYYEEQLAVDEEIDFEGMILEALKLVRSRSGVRDLLVSRFPHMVVDEYQDLGGPLHSLILALRDSGMIIFAVGDPDQCIFGFTGADPRYLEELADELGVQPIHLRFNYRAGSSLIAAAEGVLDSPRGYEPDPSRADPGSIIFRESEGGLESQAADIVSDVIPTLIANGTAAHDIAVLYTRRGQLLDLIEEKFAASTVPYVLERDARFPEAPIVKWLQRCASKAIDPDAPGTDDFAELFYPYEQLIEDAEATSEHRLDDQSRLLEALESDASPDDRLADWIRTFDEATGLSILLEREGARPDDKEAIRVLREPGNSEAEDITLADFAGGAQVYGKVAITTYHGSKGRQFSAVILPGLQRTLLPWMRWNSRKRDYEISGRQMSDDRRLFYVGVTRARHAVVLLYSPSFRNQFGYKLDGRSPFIDDLAGRLGA